MKNEIELLAPGGDVDSIKAAILAGANAIYCGLDRFNARSQAKNIGLEELMVFYDWPIKIIVKYF